MKILKTTILLGAVLALAGCGAPKQMDHDHAEGMEGMDHMHHGQGIEVTGPVPTVDLILHRDPMSGWNAQIITTDFRFAPESASLENKEGEGHAHIYVNGEKINRIYGEWYHLADTTPGDTVMVNLNANDHSPLLFGGIEIADEEIIEE